MVCTESGHGGGSDRQVRRGHVNTIGWNGGELRSQAVGSTGVWAPNDSFHNANVCTPTAHAVSCSYNTVSGLNRTAPP